MAIGAVSSVTEKPGLQEVENVFHRHHELVYRTAYSILNNTSSLRWSRRCDTAD